MSLTKLNANEAPTPTLPEIAPTTVNNFVVLALNGYYSGLTFWKSEDWVVQSGDPGGDGRGGPGYTLPDEPNTTPTWALGAVGMARATDPNTNGSQFYITLAAAHNLDGQYTLFARVVEGAPVLDLIVRGEPPASPTRMRRVYIVEKPR